MFQMRNLVADHVIQHITGANIKRQESIRRPSDEQLPHRDDVSRKSIFDMGLLMIAAFALASGSISARACSITQRFRLLVTSLRAV